MKLCIKCNELLPIKHFSKNGKYFRNECNQCRSAYNLELYHKKQRCTPARRKASYKYTLKNKYGLTPEQVEEMRIKQNNRCALCNEETKLHVDHCHASNQVRELLCNTCNLGLGSLKDNPELLRKGAEYIEMHRRYRDERINQPG